MSEKAKGILTGAMLLTVSGLLVKLLGMIYKLPLANMLLDEGMGYFNTAYTVFSLFFVLSGSGIPTALSLLVAKDLACQDRALAEARFYAMRRFSWLMGGALFGFLFLFSLPIACLVGSRGAFYSLLAISPAVLFVTLSAPIRGYAQGQGNMLPTAISSLVEAIIKLALGLLLVALAEKLSLSLPVKSAMALLGLSGAAALSYGSLCLLTRGSFQKNGRYGKEKGPLLNATLKASLPVTASSVCLSLSSALDLILLMRMLESIGYSEALANAAWGNYSALVLPLFHMPQVVLTPIASALLPKLRALTAEQNERQGRSLTEGALTVTAVLSATASLGLSLFSRDILALLFHNTDAVAHAAPHLSLLAVAVFPFGIMTVATAVLQAHGKLWLPVISLGAGATVKLLATLFLTGSLGESVSAFGTLLLYTVAAAIDLAALSGLFRRSLLIKITLKPFLVAFLSVMAALFVRALVGGSFPESIRTLISITAALVTAALGCLLTGVFGKVRACAD